MHQGPGTYFDQRANFVFLVNASLQKRQFKYKYILWQIIWKTICVCVCVCVCVWMCVRVYVRERERVSEKGNGVVSWQQYYPNKPM